MPAGWRARDGIPPARAAALGLLVVLKNESGSPEIRRRAKEALRIHRIANQLYRKENGRA